MMNKRTARNDRRQDERRKNNFDARSETEKGMVGEQRSGKDRRNRVRDRRVHDQFAISLENA